jgi:hypothetical protein
VDETLTPEGHHVGLGVTPVAQRRSPLAGAVQVERLLADENHRAVDAAGHDRRDLFRRHSNHRLIEQRQTLSVSPHHNERAALSQPTERDKVGFTEPSTDGERFYEHVVSP